MPLSRGLPGTLSRLGLSVDVCVRALGPRKSIAHCTRRSPGLPSADAGSIPATSTTHGHVAHFTVKTRGSILRSGPSLSAGVEDRP